MNYSDTATERKENTSPMTGNPQGPGGRCEAECSHISFPKSKTHSRQQRNAIWPVDGNSSIPNRNFSTNAIFTQFPCYSELLSEQCPRFNWILSSGKRQCMKFVYTSLRSDLLIGDNHAILSIKRYVERSYLLVSIFNEACFVSELLSA